MSEIEPTRTAPRCPTWVKLVLALSLAANLLIVGIVLGAIAGTRRGEDGARLFPAREVGATPYIMALDRGDRMALLRDMREGAAGLRQNRDALRSGLEQLLASLRAESFDPAAVRLILSEQRGNALRRQDLGEAALLARLEAMSVGERRDYADRLEASLRRIRRPDG